MRITFDALKRERTLSDRGLDFEDAAIVFEGITVEVEDLRKNYGERRIICYGWLSGGALSGLATPHGAQLATYSACERQTIVKKPVSPRTLKSDLARVDAHSVRAHEYKELPEVTAQALARATVNKGGRPRSANPRKLISIRLPVDVIERWKATGPGWQTRIAERLSKRR
jgi:uncharacterized protein (DUF4415 family)/uncharacterized DUF497 family protein